MSSRVLTAVAWPYANGPRHIGHVSGFGVPSDVFSRFQRMNGEKVLMVADGNADFAKAVGLEMDGSGYGMGTRIRRFSMKPGRCLAEQVGVNAPGRPNRTTFLPLNISSVVMSLMPSLVMCFSLTEGTLSPTLIIACALSSLEYLAGRAAARLGALL